MTFEELQKKALEIKKAYAKQNRAKKLKPWQSAEFMQGFVGDVGDLAKLVLAKNGLREIENVDTKIAHELADCLWSIMVLSEELNVNLEKEFLKTIDELKKRTSH